MVAALTWDVRSPPQIDRGVKEHLRDEQARHRASGLAERSNDANATALLFDGGPCCKELVLRSGWVVGGSVGGGKGNGTAASFKIVVVSSAMQ